MTLVKTALKVEDLEYIDIDYETNVDRDIFDRFLGVDIVQEVDGAKTVQPGFPMPITQNGTSSVY